MNEPTIAATSMRTALTLLAFTVIFTGAHGMDILRDQACRSTRPRRPRR